MSDDIFLCRACNPNPGEVKTLGIPRRACAYCGAICANGRGHGLPLGDLVNRSDAPPPRALSRAEVEAQIRPPPDPPLPPNRFIAPEGERCAGSATICGGDCALAKFHDGVCVCYPDPETGEETCQA